jgi:ribosomal protein S18 acetylase RimI-like enzyme
MPFEEFQYYRVESLGDRFDPTLWHLAEVDGALAGVAICLEGKRRDDPTGWVSLLGVRREFRGRGIGEALLRSAFADFYRRGYRKVSLGVDASSLTGADRLYRRAGMREVKRGFYYEKELRAGRHSEAGNPALDCDEGSDR